MCRLALKTSIEVFSPYEVLEAMEAMQEGYDGSGLGLLLRGVKFTDFNYKPDKQVILSGIAHSEAALARMDRYMESRGFVQKYDHEFTIVPGLVESSRYKYVVRVYNTPPGIEGDALEEYLLDTRLQMRLDGEQHGDDLTVFSLWQDVITLKEVGWPLEVGDTLSLHDDRISARVVMAQGRQNTNYGINLYACHPFFIQGIATMTNGENTAFVPIKEWLEGKNIKGYTGYQSDSEVFAHILHYVVKKLKLPLEVYKHVITPLKGEEMAAHPQGEFLQGLKTACRRLIIDGPNAIIGTLPDETCLLTMDAKKMRPAAVGGKPGTWAIASEMCGVQALVPDRDPALDYQPMREETIIIPPDRKEIITWTQFDPFTLPQVA